jgi:DNA polymerase-3 subunit delta'
MQWKLYGHDTAIALLKRQVQPEKLRHAYLITGPEGVGRRSLALAFAQALNCLNPGTQGDFCGECLLCRQIQAEAFADLTMITAEAGKELKIDQIRAMQQSLALKPYQSRYRIVIIQDFQKATVSASNALLKSLEEPPSHAVIILTADAAESLLATIVSRCELVRLRPASMQTSLKALQETGLSAQEATRLAHLCGGRLGLAKRLMEDEDLIAERLEMLDQLLELLPLKRRERLQWCEAYLRQKAASRELVASLVPIWLSFWRDVLISVTAAELPLVNLDRKAELAAVAEQMTAAESLALLRAHEAALEQAEAYVNARLLLENLVLLAPQVNLEFA